MTEPSSTTRRHFLLGAGAVVGVAFGGPLLGACSRGTIDESLRHLPLFEGEIRDGARHLQLTASSGLTKLAGPQTTPTMGWNGQYLGPTIRLKRGDQIVATIANDLDEMTTLHWHGMELPAIADGGPATPIEAGEQTTVRWVVDQAAATLWYHPHPAGNTAAQSLAGLVGLVIIDDDDDHGLPDRWGVDDVGLVVQDLRIGVDGTIRIAEREINDTVVTLVNGQPAPRATVAPGRVRLRLLNASDSRVLRLVRSDGQPLTVVGSDGGLLETAVDVDELPVSSGERYELLIEDHTSELSLLTIDGETPETILRLEPDGPGETVPFSGPAIERPTEPGATTRTIVLDKIDGQLSINGRSMTGHTSEEETTEEETAEPPKTEHSGGAMAAADQIPAGATEIWEVHNAHGEQHNFHIHAVQFHILEISGAPPPPHLQGRKDVVSLQPGETARLLMRFPNFPDPSTPYMYHCHIFTHEDAGMMWQFVLVDQSIARTSTSPTPSSRLFCAVAR